VNYKKTAPDVNGRIAFGKFIPYTNCNVSCLVDIEGGKDLASVTVEDVDKMSIEDVADYLKSKATRIKTTGGDEEHKKRIGPMKFIPSYIIGIILELTSFVGVTLGISVPALGLKKYAFGGCLVTSVGMMGVKDTYAPFTPFTRVPVLVVVCSVEKKAVVENDKIIIAPVLGINFTVDHRFMDGARASKLIHSIQDVFDNPETYSKYTDKKGLTS